MSSNLKRQIECLKRLEELSGNSEDILAFLLAENLIDKSYIMAYRKSADKPKELQKLLANLSATNKLQLLEYEWSILPIELIRILIVTDRDSKTFGWGT